MRIIEPLDGLPGGRRRPKEEFADIGGRAVVCEREGGGVGDARLGGAEGGRGGRKGYRVRHRHGAWECGDKSRQPANDGTGVEQLPGRVADTLWLRLA